jgi:hypothetical protein
VTGQPPGSGETKPDPQPTDPQPPQSQQPQGQQAASQQPDPDPAPGPVARAEDAPSAGEQTESKENSEENSKEKRDSVVAQVVGSTSFLGALLIYMGWNYDSQLLQQFSVPAPAGIGVSTVNFALTGLTPLLRSYLVFVGAALVAAVLLASRVSGPLLGKRKKPAGAPGQPATPGQPTTLSQPAAGGGKSGWTLFASGLLLTVVTLSLAWPQVHDDAFGGWLSGQANLVYLLLGLLAVGQVLMAWPVRRSVAGQVIYPLALVLAAVLTLWAGGVYARMVGTQDATRIENDPGLEPAVAVYSAQSLGLSGPGVTCVRDQPGTGYPYECTGLRLLWVESGTYYLLPAGWTRGRGDSTYVLDDSNQIRIEFYCIPRTQAQQC